MVSCSYCRHEVEPNPAEMAERYGAETRCRTAPSGWCAGSAGAAKPVSWVAGASTILPAVKRNLEIERAAVYEP